MVSTDQFERENRAQQDIWMKESERNENISKRKKKKEKGRLTVLKLFLRVTTNEDISIVGHGGSSPTATFGFTK